MSLVSPSSLSKCNQVDCPFKSTTEDIQYLFLLLGLLGIKLMRAVTNDYYFCWRLIRWLFWSTTCQIIVKNAINVLFYSTKICSLRLHEIKKVTNTYKCETLFMEFLAVLLWKLTSTITYQSSCPLIYWWSTTTLLLANRFSSITYNFYLFKLSILILFCV